MRYFYCHNFTKRTFDFIIKTFLDNGCPMNFIFQTFSIRLRNLFNKRTRKQNVDNTNDVEFKGWFLIPFIPKAADKFKKITK